MNELSKRIIVGVIGIPLAILIIYLGSYYFFIAILLISILGLWEFYKLVEAKGFSPMKYSGILSLIILEITFYLMYIDNSFLSSIKYISYFIFEIIIISLFLMILNLFRNKGNSIINLSTTLSGLAIIIIPFLSLIAIRNGNFDLYDNGLAYLIMVYFASIWICDSAAYFIGRKWGKHKIATKVSPKKSWEGAIAGLAGAVLTFMIFSVLLIWPLSTIESLIFGLTIGILGQVGDFFESSLKRDAEVKDSSSLLSAHGGVLDRFDSIMFTAPAILLLIILFL